jgi:hypothetical protein
MKESTLVLEKDEAAATPALPLIFLRNRQFP